MRLYNTYYVCKKFVDDISELSFASINLGQAYVIQNWERYKETLLVVRQVPFLKSHVDSFYNIVPVFVREDVEPRIDSTIRSKLEAKKKVTVDKMQAVIELYEDLDIAPNGNGIDVKIPHCGSLKEYMAYLKEIDFIFSQCPFLQHEEGEIRFHTVDVGSQWLTFLIVSASGAAVASYILSNLAQLVDKAVQVKSHLLNLKQQEEILRSQKLQNEALDASIESFQILRKHYLEEAIKEIEYENESVTLQDGEERGKAEKSLEKLCALMDKGVEIYASVDTRREIQMLFPALGGNIELPESVLKLIEDKKEG